MIRALRFASGLCFAIGVPFAAVGTAFMWIGNWCEHGAQVVRHKRLLVRQQAARLQ